MRRLATTLLVAQLLTACGAEEARIDKRHSTGRSSDDATRGDDGGTADGDDGAAEGDGADAGGGGDGSTDGGTEGSGDGGGTGGSKPSPAVLGRKFYDETVVKYFQTNCRSCHADPREPADIRGPQSIYSYEKMKALLKTGQSAASNGLVDKVSGAVLHAGGNRCSAGLTSMPCKAVIEWWNIEFADGGPGAVARGRITDVSATGRVFGWATNATDDKALVEVKLYVDGPAATGELIGTVVANKDGEDGNTNGEHAFSFDLPASLKDKAPHQMHAYAVINGKEEQLGTSAYAFTAYDFSQAGRDFYAANVQGQLAACQGCHAVAYENQFYSLISPSPAKGGTAANNAMINNPSQTNGETHGGGLRCGSATTGVCAAFQQWWQIEFGQ